MDSEALDYDLPQELIAQRPADPRDASRLLVFDRATGDVRHRRFRELPEELTRGELVVVNDSRVVPARLRLRRPGGGAAEVLLLEQRGGRTVGGAGPAVGAAAHGSWTSVRSSSSSRWARGAGSSACAASRRGRRRCPPYITEPLDDPERYQTVYSREPGSAAAPTAGLHFTPELLARLDVEHVTLHVGLDTFRPLTAPTLDGHRLHGERYSVEPAAWERIREAPRVLAAGTTTVRVLESLARDAPLAGRTELFVAPGFEFRRVDALLTNFHLPRTTLLALVMAFAGVEETRELYRLAIAERYRFYSFGDAMLIL